MSNNALVAHPALKQGFYLGPTPVVRIYIRPAYAKVLSQVDLNKTPGITGDWTMLTGTPGIGKSMFAIYLTHLIVHDEVLSSSIKRVCLVQRTETDTRTLYFVKDEADHWRAATLKEAQTAPDALISDCSDPERRASASALVKYNIIVSSPRGVS